MTLIDFRSVNLAREQMFETGTVGRQLAGSVRPEILASWRRSMSFGAEEHVRSLPYNDNLGASERLIAAAEPVLSSLAESLTGLDAGVLLSDRDANIIRRWVASREIANALDRISSDRGFGAPEDLVGTNGIGTVAELGRPQMVVGPEHYATSLVGFACVGAPIVNPVTNRREGIVTLSCRADAANALLTPLIIGTASDIENRLLEAASVSERSLLDAFLAAKKHHRLVVALNRDTLMASPRGNRALARLAGRDELWNLAVDQIGNEPMSVVVELVDGRETTIELAPVRVHDRLVGATVVLDSIDAPSYRSEDIRPNAATEKPSFERALPGSSPRWQSILQSAARHAAGTSSLVIEGPSGCGKWTLAQLMIESAHSADTVLAIDAVELVNDHCRRAVTDISVAPEVLLIRHVDLLEPSGAAAIIEVTSRLRPATTRIIATRGSHGSTSAPAQRVLERFEFVSLGLPALGEHTEDIPDIVQHIVACDPNGSHAYLSPDALSELRRASWPGNVRQLKEVVQSLLAARVGQIGTDDLPVDVRSSAMRRTLSHIEQLECGAIIRALRDADGNKMVAAKLVGISRSTMYRKIRSYGIDCETTFF